MKVALQQLNTRLNKALDAVYLIHGDVPLLAQETRDSLREAARKKGFIERETFYVEGRFDWNQFIARTQSMNLFSDKLFIELYNPDAKFDTKGTDALQQYLKNPSPDIILIIITNKLTGAQQKTKWFKAVDQNGVHIPLWPITGSELQQWIAARLKRANLTADPAAMHLLADLTEGNLLSTNQAIEKCNLLYPKGHITPEMMSMATCDNARYTPFDLVNATLAGNNAQAIRIIKNLSMEGGEATLILWALTREIRLLIDMQHQIQQGSRLMDVIAHEWAQRKPLIQSALRRLPLKTLQDLLIHAQDIDKSIKGIITLNTWNALESLVLRMGSHVKPI